MTPMARRRLRGRRAHALPAIILFVFASFATLGIAATAGLVANAAAYVDEIPDNVDLESYMDSRPSQVLDRDGNVIGEFKIQNRQTVTKDEISDYVLKGVVDTEDVRFYQHKGFDIVGIGRAVLANLSGRSEGASTLTQQLVRNTILSDEQFDKTMSRKVKEVFLAVEIEQRFSKDEILTMYLNTVYYGQGAYGIESASQTYFGKSAKDLTLPEAALLAGLPNAPSSYDPTKAPDLAVQRRNIVLDRMLTAGDITQQEHNDAQAAPLELNFHEQQINESGALKYPWFVDYVRERLLQTYSADLVYKGGLTVQTTLDPKAQDAAETAVNDTLSKVGNDQIQAALVVLKPDTGEILAMVGGREHTQAGQYNAAVQAQRQPGSSFKAITLTAAVENGMNPDVLVDASSPKQVTPTWKVQNYGNHNYGTISLARATEVSSNTAYAQVALAIGADKVAEMGNRLGITTKLPSNPSLTLGTTGVSPMEMAEVYATLANGGVHNDAYGISEVTSHDGKQLYKASSNPQRVISKEVASAVTGVLEGVVANGTAKGFGLSTQPTAGKTGTTEDVRDLWFCGYTPQMATAIWTGYSQEQTMKIGRRDAQTTDLPLPIFKEMASTYLKGVPTGSFDLSDDDPDYKENEEWGWADKDNKDQADAEAAAQAAQEEAQRLADEQAARDAANEAANQAAKDSTTSKNQNKGSSEMDTQGGSTYNKNTGGSGSKPSGGNTNTSSGETAGGNTNSGGSSGESGTDKGETGGETDGGSVPTQ